MCCITYLDWKKCELAIITAPSSSSNSPSHECQSLENGLLVIISKTVCASFVTGPPSTQFISRTTLHRIACPNGAPSPIIYLVKHSSEIGIAQLVQRLATGWTVLGSNSGGGKIFRNRPDRPWGPPSLLYDRYRVLPGGKGSRRVTLTTHPHLDLRSWKSWAIPLLTSGPCGLLQGETTPYNTLW